MPKKSKKTLGFSRKESARQATERPQPWNGPRIKSMMIDGDQWFYSLSFDIDDLFYHDGIYWLQIYDSERLLIYDKPIGNSSWMPNKKDVRKTMIAMFHPRKWPCKALRKGS